MGHTERVVSGSLEALQSGGAGLGLQLDDTRVVEHVAGWSELYTRLETDLHHVLDGLDATIEHIGSTAVQGLWAKPILDVGIGLADDADMDETVSRLGSFGITFNRDLGDFGGLFLSAEDSESAVVLHVHVVRRTDAQWGRYLAFRDALRTDPDLAAEYSRVKRELARNHPADRPSYLHGKSTWVLRTLGLVDVHTPLS
jgi:GrpB-like predicted nucleotidyltransferase (UPF0157 family)